MAKIGSTIVPELSGKLGTVIFRQTKFGTQMVPREKPRNPRTPAQEATRQRMSQVMTAWKSMSLEVAAAWRSYAFNLQIARGEPERTPANVFSHLALRFLQANPNSEIPLTPPTAPFGGDDVRVTLAAGSKKVILDVTRGNSPGVVTEVLFQPLASIHRATYSAKYRSQGFFAAQSGEPIELPARPGVVAVAIRMVESATGQATGILELGRVVVS